MGPVRSFGSESARAATNRSPDFASPADLEAYEVKASSGRTSASSVESLRSLGPFGTETSLTPVRKIDSTPTQTLEHEDEDEPLTPGLA
jgi:hypothetical protein